jgi:DNA-binding transcriptional MerR regulator
MISINEACNNLSINPKKARYYMYTKEIKYLIKDNKFYLEDEDYHILKKIVLLRRLGLSFDDIDDIKKNNNLGKYLLKLYNLIPEGNKYDAIKKIVDIMYKDKVTYINMDVDKYLELVNNKMREGKLFYSFNEDITYEDYKSSKFNIEYIVMISLVSLLFVILTLTQDIELFISLFPFFFIGLILTLVVFYIPIKVKYYRGIMKLLRREQNEKN